MASFLRLLFFLLLTCVAKAVDAQDAQPSLVKVDVDRNKSCLRLSDYGGPRIEIRMRNREMSYVAIDIVDYTRMIRMTDSQNSIPSPDSITEVPTRYTKNVDKRNGINYPPSNHDMYLLFEEPKSGAKVYYLDDIAPQNCDSFVVSMPARGATHKNGLAGRHPGTPPPKSEASAESSTAPAAPQFLSNELAAWYGRLGREREALDVNNAQAVEAYNKHAAEYRGALAKARAEALQQAPK